MKEHLSQLDIMAEALIKHETIDRKQIDAIMQGKRPRFPKVSSKKKPKNDITGAE